MNKVMLIGNVGKDPEIRYFDADECVASFTLATTERGYVLPNGTQVPNRTDWHNIILFKHLAKYAEKYIHKGDKIFVEGRIRNRSYDDKKGVRRVITEIYAENLEWLAAPRKVVDEVVKTNAPADGSYADEDKSKLPF
ncbi:single-stranded DNA-binding protein [Prevotella amnii]|uniref:Single-stranded DNA-binding protein n=2 Tax=Prevotella amnii TaxID=419005 RepID=A0A096B310_9BACT|nr:single-stranded DNA-binding protein [Prevotella amnii]KGF53440.1 single-stranded DNA-binding protein [Prevotella amnii DNF00058]KXB74332.1 single-strand binding family protein [Prevotella amnii]